jgi:Na+-transporting methylmalonyl-CoA/oxaloacetate decarboxylase gamma subunit
MNTNQNQTDFAQSEPLLEDVMLPESPEVPEDPLELEGKKAKQRKLIVLIAVGVGIVFLLVVLLIAVMSTEAPKESEVEVPSLERPQSEKDVTQIDRELEVLKDRLDIIDPTREYVTVPPVDYTLRLE